MDRKLRMGMIGGGNGAIHPEPYTGGSLMDNQIELVCGCFSSRPTSRWLPGGNTFYPTSGSTPRSAR